MARGGAGVRSSTRDDAGRQRWLASRMTCSPPLTDAWMCARGPPRVRMVSVSLKVKLGPSHSKRGNQMKKRLSWKEIRGVFGRQSVVPGDTLVINDEEYEVSRVGSDGVEFELAEPGDDDQDDDADPDSEE